MSRHLRIKTPNLAPWLCLTRKHGLAPWCALHAVTMGEGDKGGRPGNLPKKPSAATLPPPRPPLSTCLPESRRDCPSDANTRVTSSPACLPPPVTEPVARGRGSALSVCYFPRARESA